jgi:hypothetical protein
VRRSGIPTAMWIVAAIVGCFVLFICLPSIGGFFFALLAPRGVAPPIAQPPLKGMAMPPPDVRVEPPVEEGPIFVAAPFQLGEKGRPVKVFEKSTVRLPIDAGPAFLRDILFAPKSWQFGYFWAEPPGNGRMHFNLHDAKTGERRARVEIPGDHGAFDGLSPNGTRLLTHQFKPSALNILSLPDGKILKKAWHPYADQPDVAFGFNRADVAWAAFLDEEHLLTIAVSGRFDLWDGDFDKPKYTRPSPKKLPLMSVNGFARGPQNLALSEDRKTLALANGDGYDFFNAWDGKKIGATESLGDEGRIGNVWATAFSRDGALLASTYRIQLPGQPLAGRETLTIWSVADGKRKWHFSIEDHHKLKGPIVWFGPKHLLFWDGNVYQGAVFDIDTGRFLRVLHKGINSDHFARQPPDEHIWFASSNGTKGKKTEMIAVDFPAGDLRNNPVPPAALDQLPLWIATPEGIGHVVPAK